MSMCRKQHCLKVAGKPAEGSMPGHTHCRAAPFIANSQEIGFFVLVCITVLLRDTPSGSGEGESSMAQFHPSLREKGTESVILPFSPREKYSMLRSVLIEAFCTTAAGAGTRQAPWEAALPFR